MSISSEQIRQSRQQFRQDPARGHHTVAPCSVIPSQEDKTVIFNTSGMQQLVPYLTGQVHPAGKRLFNIQPCIRTNDIENIGETERHLSFFEMMGNRSLGDYFKHDALRRSLEFLVEVMHIPLEKLGGTYFGGMVDEHGNEIIPIDTTARDIFISLGIPGERLTSIPMINGASDNFRGPPGAIGPCGPCSEIFFDRGEEYGPADRALGTNDRYVEIRNNVFMEYYKDDKAQFTLMKQQNVDTGMGFERFVMILNNCETIFETDLFADVLHILEQRTEKKYPGYLSKYDQKTFAGPAIKHWRVVADHSRSVTMMIADGVIPSNESRGYVARRLIRRMTYHMIQLAGGMDTYDIQQINKIIDQILHVITQKYGHIYPQITDNANKIATTIHHEITQFDRTLQKGLQLIHHKIVQKNLTAEDTFTLYHTFGFPIDLTVEIAATHGVSISSYEVEQLLAQAQDRSRQSSQMFTKQIDRAAVVGNLPATTFTGYQSVSEDDVTILLDTIVNDHRIIVTDRTPFYAESGGQRGDTGSITLESGQTLTVLDTKKYNGVYLHFVR